MDGLGWQQKSEKMCLELKIPDINLNYVKKDAIKQAIFNCHQNEIMKNILNSKKLVDIKNDNFSIFQP